MTPDQLASIVEFLNKGGVVGVLVMVVVVGGWGAVKGWWYPKPYITELRRQNNELRDERDAWRTVALGAQSVASRAVEAAESQLGLRRQGG